MEDKVGVHHEIANLKGKLNAVYNKIKVTTEVGRNISSDTSQLDIFEARYKDLKSLYERFENVFDELRLLSIRSGQEQTFPDSNLKTLSATAERYYYECCAIFNSYQLKSSNISNTDVSGVNNNSSFEGRRSLARLPKLTLPHFSGQLTEWTQFIDTFNSIIHHDVTLSSVEKFHYLLGSTSGPPHTILKAIPLVEANYVLAYEALVDRYDNKRLLASSYLENILNFAPLRSKPTLSCLQSLLSILSENAAALQTMAVPDLADFILMNLGVRLLDPVSRRDFESDHVKEMFPSFVALKDFLKTKCQVMELSHNSSSSIKNQPRDLIYKSTLFSATSTVAEKQSPLNNNGSHARKYTCPCCKQAHRLSECAKFISLTPQQRYSAVKSYNICLNCFGSHSCKNCTSPYFCRRCKGHHHTLLHFNSPTKPFSPKKELNKTDSSDRRNTNENHSVGTSAPVLSSTCIGRSEVLLGTALAFIYDVAGTPHPVRLVLDSGSHFSFVTSALAKRLGLPQRDFKQLISGVGQANLQGVKKKLNCVLSPRDKPELRLNTEAIIVPTITSNLPVSNLPSSIIKTFSSLHLADPRFWESAPVDFLLGSDLFSSILTGGKMSFSEEEPNGLSTNFGWVIMGRFSNPLVQVQSQDMCSLFLSISPPIIDDILKKFWEVEEPCAVTVANPDDVRCEEHFVKTITRDTSGRYVVRLPFKPTEFDLGNNRQVVLSRFLKLETRLSRQPQLYEEYNNFLKEYLELGHMSVAKMASPYIIPHHCVIKHDSITTKLRVVFDASFSLYSSYSSLNNSLLPGPKLQLDIADILLNFRIHPIVFVADICKMFRQISLHPADRKYTHIYWRPSPEQPVVEYELNTVTYGLTCSPFQANRVLIQLVDDEGANFPLASNVLRKSVYIDDIADGANDIQTALKLQSELVELLSRGGFELRKWSSNSPELLKCVPPEHQIPLSFSYKADSVLKVLGLQWDPSRDCYSFEIRPPNNVICTKRAVLSEIARIYDPLGFLSPVVFYAKHLMQELWQIKLSWDEELPLSFREIWTSFVQSLPQLSSLTIKRHILPLDRVKCQVLGFCDASQRGYAASIYLRVTRTSGDVNIYLLKSKTRLAPLKTISVPRLELCGALLLSQLLLSTKTFCQELNLEKIFLFTDSTIVLCWLSTSPHLLKTFVANRVATILDLTKTFNCSWHHIPTDQNPADCASRGLTPSELINFLLWWNGPLWALNDFDVWPVDLEKSWTEKIPEIKDTARLCLTATSSLDESMIKNIEKFSSFSKLLRVWAYVLRFVHLLKHPHSSGSKSSGPIAHKELTAAAKTCVKLVQRYYFRDEYLKVNNFTCSKQLARLTPFFDEEGIIRVGGRLRLSNYPSNFKHPIILPSKCHFSNLVVDYFHKICLHAGPRTLQSLVQREYWILGARSLIRHRIFKCIKCYRLKALSRVPIMGDLPSSRFVQGRPFINVAVDYAGPFLIKESTRRNAKVTKAYLCVFVCMATKAVHLEAVSSLSSESFLACLDRFLARRGMCSKIYSDCGRNFVGAARHLKELQLFINKNDTRTVIVDHLATKGITWIFQPPYAPNFNGLVESGVKSTKYHLTRIIGETSLSFEELSTLFARIEAVLNSRPLSPLSSDPSEFDALTPGHFIIGGPLVARLEPDVSEVPTNRLGRWQLLQKFIQHFWKRWSDEYIHTLQQRCKWTKPVPNISVGDLVLLKSTSTSPLSWPLARVTATHPGEDGVVRVVTIKTSCSVFTRPVSKVVLIGDSPQESFL